MFEKKYKADNERIEPTRESLLSLSYKMKREQAKKKDKKKAVRWIRPAAAVAAARSDGFEFVGRDGADGVVTPDFA